MKRGSDRRRASVDVDFDLTVLCNPETDSLELDTGNFRVAAKGFGGGRVWEKKIRSKLGKFGSALNVAVSLGRGVSCGDLNPRFDGAANLLF